MYIYKVEVEDAARIYVRIYIAPYACIYIQGVL